MKKTQIIIALIVMGLVHGSVGLAVENGVSELVRGNKLALGGDYAEALAAFDKAIKLDPKLAQAFSHRAATLVQLGKYKEALSDCNTAIKLNSKDVRAHVLRGLIYKQLGKRSKEINDMRTAKKLIQGTKKKNHADDNHIGFKSDSNSSNLIRVSPAN